MLSAIPHFHRFFSVCEAAAVEVKSDEETEVPIRQQLRDARNLKIALYNCLFSGVKAIFRSVAEILENFPFGSHRVSEVVAA